jgi:hypothetical protein
MQKDFERLFHRAEDHYLIPVEMVALHKHIGLLGKRLETYRYLRDNENAIFQAVADRLEADFPDEPTQRLEQCLCHWISTLRYSSMAMLLSNPEYLQYRLLEWLTEMVEAHELRGIETRLAEILTERLQKDLSAEGFTLLKPFLTQSETILLAKAAPQSAQPAMAGGQS